MTVPSLEEVSVDGEPAMYDRMAYNTRLTINALADMSDADRLVCCCVVCRCVSVLVCHVSLLVCQCVCNDMLTCLMLTGVCVDVWVCCCVGLSLCRCVSVLVCQCVGVSVCQCVVVSLCWYVNRSVWCVIGLVCWYVNVLACRCVGV